MTITEIKQRNRAAGFYFFEPATMRFFDSRVVPGTYTSKNGELVYFITSEQFHGSAGSEPRKFTVRQFNIKTADIDTPGQFNDIRDLSSARTAARLLARGEETRTAA